MKELKSYILEKLVINKDSKVIKTRKRPKWISYNSFRSAIKKYGEVNLADIYRDPEDYPKVLRYTNGKTLAVSIKSLYIVQNDVYYSYYNVDKKSDYEGALEYEELSNKDKELIYDYITKN